MRTPPLRHGAPNPTVLALLPLEFEDESHEEEKWEPPNHYYPRLRFKRRAGITRSVNKVAIRRHARAQARQAWRARQRNRRLARGTWA